MSALQGKVALVTGASRGIGLAVAEALGAAGARVVRVARSLTDQVGKDRCDFRCDVTDAPAVERVMRRAVEAAGLPDILVNNAGAFINRPLGETSPKDFSDVIAVNLTGTFLVARALVPQFQRRGSGHLVTIGSISDHRAFTGNTAYAASKWGVRGLHEVIATELQGSGVRTTLVSPGPVDTALWDEIDPDAREGWTKRADMLHATDVADAVLFAVTRPARAGVEEIRLHPAVYRPRH